MSPIDILILGSAGLFSGVLAGFLGVGGGSILVPFLVTLGYTPLQAVATSSLTIFITSVSGSIENWRMGYLDFKRVISLGLPALVTAQIGVYFASHLAPYLLLTAFGFLLLVNIYLVELRKQLTGDEESNEPQELNTIISIIGTGSTAGVLAGLFGVGGGVVMVPLQILLLGETIKVAIQTSLGVVGITALSSCIGHAFGGNVLFTKGIIMGIGGLCGASLSTRILPKLADEVVSLAFRILLGLLSVYIFWLAFVTYSEPAI